MPTKIIENGITADAVSRTINIPIIKQIIHRCLLMERSLNEVQDGIRLQLKDLSLNDVVVSNNPACKGGRREAQVTLFEGRFTIIVWVYCKIENQVEQALRDATSKINALMKVSTVLKKLGIQLKDYSLNVAYEKLGERSATIYLLSKADFPVVDDGEINRAIVIVNALDR